MLPFFPWSHCPGSGVPLGLNQALSPLLLLGGHRLGVMGGLHPGCCPPAGLKAGGGCPFPGPFPFQHQHKATTKQRMPQLGPGNSQVWLWGQGEEPTLLSRVGPDPWGRGAVGHSGSPLRADRRVLYEAPRRPLPWRGRDKGVGSTDLGRRVNTGCWLLPTPTALPSSSRCRRGSQQPPRVRPSHGPLSLTAGTPQRRVAKDTAHAGAWRESFIHSSHHQF